MVVKKTKTYCKKCGIWSFWTQENQGKCTICFPKKEKKKIKKNE